MFGPGQRKAAFDMTNQFFGPEHVTLNAGALG